MKVVGIGASAGGIEALTQFLPNLSTDSGAAYVIVQHLSPDFKSIMEELLQKHTSMPVHMLEKNQTLEPNKIYLMPSHKTVVYQQGVLVLQDRPSANKLNLPIDEFFHSLGSDLKSNAIAVVLSGTGTDGSRGARTIKECEGIVMVQSPESAEFDGMPKALIQLDIADGILPPDQLAKKLNEIIRLEQYLRKQENGSHSSDSGDRAGKEPKNDPIVTKQKYFYDIMSLASERANISFSDYKEATLRRRIEKQMAFHHCLELKDYFEFLQKNEAQIETLCLDFLISVTQFFRDKEFFDELKEKIIPAIFSRLEEEETCRIWVAACSTGEEAYSIGMLVLEYLRTNNLNQDFKIFASDINKKSILFANQGIYNSSVLADVPTDFLNRYFYKKGDYFQVVNELRDRIIFAVHDAIADPPFINMSLISCRNFLIYLKPRTQIQLIKSFYFSIKENRFLALGSSESVGDLNAVFKNYDFENNIFVKEGSGYNKMLQTLEVPVHHLKSPIQTTKPPTIIPPKRREEFFEEITDPFSINLLERYVPRTLFLNQDLDVLHINGNLEAILSLPKAVAQMNLKKMLPKENVHFFEDAVAAVLEDTKARYYKDISFEKKGKSTYADIRLESVELPGFDEPLVLAEINYLQERENKVNENLPVERGQNVHAQDRIMRLERQIKKQQEVMTEMVKQLEKANKELYNSNEELLQSNQDLQSSNEELQSLNEELHTVNAELQFKNKELITANNDINNLTKVTDIGTIFLDENLRIRKITKAITKQFDLVPADVGRSITAFNNKLIEVDLEKLCKQILETREPFEQEVRDKNKQQFLLRIFPYFSASGEVTEGLVLTLIDIHNVVKFKREKR